MERQHAIINNAHSGVWSHLMWRSCRAEIQEDLKEPFQEPAAGKHW